MRRECGIIRHCIVAVMLLAAAFTAVDGNARKNNTQRKNVTSRTTTANKHEVTISDSILIPDSMQVRCFGYDKPLRSSRESFFITNNTAFDISKLFFTTQYIDTKERQFHQLSDCQQADIPAGETRQITFPSWDKQQSFYYIGSKRSRVSGTPYNVRISVDSVYVVIPGGPAEVAIPENSD